MIRSLFTQATREFGYRALLALSKLRDRLVCRDANHAACRIDEAIERVEAVARGRVGGIDPNLIDLPSAVREGQD